MSALQVLFENPRKKKRGKSQRRKSVAKRKRKNPMKTSFRAVNRKTKEVIRPLKGGTGVYPTEVEIAAQRLTVAKAKQSKKKLGRKKKSKAKKKSLTTKIKSESKKLKSMSDIRRAARSQVKDARASLKGSDFKFQSKDEYVSSSKKGKGKVKKKAKKKKAGKKAAKKKSSKKKVSRKKKSSVKKSTKKKRSVKKAAKKATKKKAAKKTSKKRSKKRSKSVTIKKGQSVEVKANPKRKRRKSRSRKYKRNPIGGGKMPVQLQKLLGFTMPELGSLALGGAFYATSNALLGRFAAPVQKALVAVPVVGTSLPNLLVGMGLNYLAGVVKAPALKNASKMIGDGLIAASVVGMGVNAAQFVPMLQPAPLSGVRYQPEFGEWRGSKADFGGVQYIPGTTTVNGIPYGMQGVDFTPEYDPAANTDFGMQAGYDQMGEFVSPDFGIEPEGLA